MNLPFVSVLTPTFNRVPLLEEAVESVLRQDYPGPWEMVIANSCVQQRLRTADPRIVILNLDDRPPLGEIRNTLVRAAKGEWFLNLDDDDLARPHYLRMCVEEVLKTGWSWAKVGGCVFMEGRDLQDIRGPTGGQQIFNRSALSAVGGYRPLHTAEDAALLQAWSDLKVPGGRIPVADERTGTFFGWGSHGGTVLHTSQGCSGDNPAAHEQLRLSQANPLTGDIELKPHWRRDYEAEFKAWIKARPA